MSEAAADAQEGGCRCGRVRFRVSGRPLLTAACHCRGCQHMTASAFSLSSGYPADAFAVIAGEPVIGGMHGATRHYGCGWCMSWLFTRPEGVEQFVNVRTSLLDVPPAEPPFVETSTATALPWAVIGAPYSFADIPPAEAWGPIVAAYAGRGNG